MECVGCLSRLFTVGAYGGVRLYNDFYILRRGGGEGEGEEGIERLGY